MPNDISTFDSSQLSHHIDRTTESKLDKKTIEPIDHTGPGYGKDNTLYTDPRLDKISLDDEHFASIQDHFIYDPGSVNYDKKDLVYQDSYLSDMNPNRSLYNEDRMGEREYDLSRKKFVGSATMLNSENNPDKQKIMDYGLNEYDKAKFNNDGIETKDPPLSPLRPFITSTSVTVST